MELNMAKEKVAPFETVKAFLNAQKAFDKAKGLLDANLKFLKKRFGEAGGPLSLPDGKLSLSALEANDKTSTSYKSIVKVLEAEIRSGAMYQRNKADQIAFLESIKEENTNPQMVSQKVSGALSNQPVKSSSVDNDSIEELIFNS